MSFGEIMGIFGEVTDDFGEITDDFGEINLIFGEIPIKPKNKARGKSMVLAESV